MEKEELIRMLREESNYLKVLLKNSNVNVDLDNFSEKTKTIAKIDFGFAIVFLLFTIRDIINEQYANAGIDSILILYELMTINPKYRVYILKKALSKLKETLNLSDEKSEIEKIDDKVLREQLTKEGLTNSERISALENAIMFLQSLTPEEEEQYLKLKM